MPKDNKNILAQFFNKEKVDKANAFFYANNTLINPISNIATILAILYIGNNIIIKIDENTKAILKSRSQIALYDVRNNQLLTAQTGKITLKSSMFKNLLAKNLENLIIDEDTFTNNKSIILKNLNDEQSAQKLYKNNTKLRNFINTYIIPTQNMNNFFFEYKNRSGYIHKLYKDLKDGNMPESIKILNSQITNYVVDEKTNKFTINITYYVKSTFKINNGLKKKYIRPVSSIKFQATGIVNPLKYYSLQNQLGYKFIDLKLTKPTKNQIKLK